MSITGHGLHGLRPDALLRVETDSGKSHRLFEFCVVLLFKYHRDIWKRFANQHFKVCFVLF